MTSDRVRNVSYNGMLVLEFDMNEHGLLCFNHSHWWGNVCRETEIEENTLSEQTIRRKGRGSWRAHKKDLMERYIKDYEKFNLTQSNVTAYVLVTTLSPDHVTNKREFALKCLTNWIKHPEQWNKATLNSWD